MTKDTMIDKIFERFDGAFAENTIRAYRSDFEQYSKWCAFKNIPPIPATADNLAMYVDDLSHTCKSATIRRRVNSLGTIFKLSKNANPTRDPEVVLALKRMHRRIGRFQKQAVPLSKNTLDKLLGGCGSDARGFRDRVLLSLGYETMRRRSELCNFKFEDLTTVHGRGPGIKLCRSKTDQEGRSRIILLSKPLYVLILEWQQRYDLTGFILRSVDRHGNLGKKLNSGSIGNIINRLCVDSVTPVTPPRFSGHSFRVGAAIDLMEQGEPIEKIMLKGGWQSETTVTSYLRHLII